MQYYRTCFALDTDGKQGARSLQSSNKQLSTLKNIFFAPGSLLSLDPEKAWAIVGLALPENFILFKLGCEESDKLIQ